MENLKNDGYAGIDAGTHASYFLGGIDEHSLKKAVQICDSQDSYGINYHTCSSYLLMMVQKSSATKQVNAAATPNVVDGVKLKNWDSTDQCLLPTKYLGSIYKMLSP